MPSAVAQGVRAVAKWLERGSIEGDATPTRCAALREPGVAAKFTEPSNLRFGKGLAVRTEWWETKRNARLTGT